MLVTYLKNLPPTKFILIQDSLQLLGEPFLNFLLSSYPHNNVIHLVFEGNYTRKATNTSFNIKYYDFTKHFAADDLAQILLTIKNDTVVVIDSLVNLIYKTSVGEAYRILHDIVQKLPEATQLIALFHTDLIEESSKVSKYFEHLATFNLILEKVLQKNAKDRVHFTYKKRGGKIIKQIEEYSFVNNQLVSEPLKKPDLAQLVQEKINQIQPEDLTTFKIGLSEEDKESRSNLVLPYLPKENTEDTPKVETGNIYYNFDHIDDWDEEDPDDDLDI